MRAMDNKAQLQPEIKLIFDKFLKDLKKTSEKLLVEEKEWMDE